MSAFISQNIGTIAVSAVVITVVCAVIIKLVKDRKSGNSTCGCGCKNCAMSEMCHKTESK